jgi:hypothetical protein
LVSFLRQCRGKAAFQQFLETGGPPPKGVEQVARYHVPRSVLGWHVLETNDMTAPPSPIGAVMS